MKLLVGIVPGGGFSFVSSAFPSSFSDKGITVESSLFNPDLWEPGNELMADHGFTVEEHLTPLGVKLIIPIVFKERSQFNEQEIVKSQQIANERIHVEKIIQQLKFYHTFDRVIPLNMAGSLNQIISVCAILSNFKEPILNNSYRHNENIHILFIYTLNY